MGVVPFYNLTNILLLVTASIEVEMFQTSFWDRILELLFLGSRVKFKKLLRLPRMPDTGARRERQIWEPCVDAKTFENARWHRESKEPGFGWSQAVPSCFLVYSNYSLLLQNSQKLLEFWPMLCRQYSRMANHASDCSTKIYGPVKTDSALKGPAGVGGEESKTYKRQKLSFPVKVASVLRRLDTLPSISVRWPENGQLLLTA
jgi:hypothetical protein